MSVFVLDTNFFIQAHRMTYPLDIFSSYWDKIKELALNGYIISIDKVKKELDENEDELSQWCKNNLPFDFFKDSTSYMREYTKVVNWAQSMNYHYNTNALTEFMDNKNADAFLIAYVLSDPSELCLVTYEISDPQSKKRIKIPEPCIHFNIKHCNPMEMFRRLSIKI